MTNEELAELERQLAEIDGKKKGQLTSLCLAYERLGRIVSRDRDYWIATAREAEALRAENERLTEARSMVEAAAASIGAVRSEYPGLWNAPGYPELTTGEVLDMARRNHLENSRGD